MEKHRILLWNASGDTAIQPRLALYAYTPEKLQGGQSLYNQTNSLGN